MKKKVKAKAKLTARQEETMKRHSEHHTSGHMKLMRSLMLKGSTFGEAHKQAMKLNMKH